MTSWAQAENKFHGLSNVSMPLMMPAASGSRADLSPGRHPPPPQPPTPAACTPAVAHVPVHFDGAGADAGGMIGAQSQCEYAALQLSTLCALAADAEARVQWQSKATTEDSGSPPDTGESWSCPNTGNTRHDRACLPCRLSFPANCRAPEGRI